MKTIKLLWLLEKDRGKMIEESIVKKVIEAFSPKIFEIENESSKHAGPRTESHFKVYIVSDNFAGLSKVERQQKVYSLLQEEFDQGLHALSLRLYTLEESKSKKTTDFFTPNCAHKIR